MLENAKRRVFEDVADNKVQYLLLVFFLFTGIAAGTFTVSNMQAETRDALCGYAGVLFLSVKIHALDHWRIFFNAFFLNTLFYGILAFFSMMTIGIVLIALLLVIKGFCFGFAVGVLALDFAGGGILAVIVCTFLPNIILLPCFCKAGVLGINNAVTIFKNRRIPSTAHDRVISAAPHFRRLFAVYMVSMLGVLIQALLTPLLMQLM